MKTFLRILMLSVLVISFSISTKAQIKSLSEASKLSKAELTKMRNEIAQKNMQQMSLKKSTPHVPAVGVSYFDDRASFSAGAVGTITAEDFHEADSRISAYWWLGDASSATNNAAFHTGDIASGIRIRPSYDWLDYYDYEDDNMSAIGPYNWGLGNEHTVVGPSYFIDKTVIEFLPAVKSVAFDIYPYFSPNDVIVTLYDASGHVIDVNENIPSDLDGGFYGVVSTTPIALITVDDPIGNDWGDCEFVGNFLFGGTGPSLIPILANMEEDWLYYGNRTNIKKITAETTASGPSTCTSAVIKVGYSYTRGKDVLLLNPGTGLRSNFNVATGTLTVSGYAPTSVYQNVIRNIIYLYFSSASIPYETDFRRVDFTLYNGSYASNTVSRYIYFDPRPDKAVQEEVASTQLPTEFSLYQNYPNPFNPVTNIRFALPQEGFTTLKVYNMLGQEVANLMNEDLVAGTYEVQFDGTKLASGTYIYRLTSGNYTETKKFILMK